MNLFQKHLKSICLQNLCDVILFKNSITKRGSGSTGLDEEKGIWYGWSHRAIFGFKIGDKIFEEDFGDDQTNFSQHGSKEIKTLDDAKLSAERFSNYVS